MTEWTYHGGKLERILHAAGLLFREHGFGATSMDAVARRADVSKATLYAYFAGKHELFAAVIKAEGDWLSAALIAPKSLAEPVRATLLRFAHVVVGLLTSAETVGSYRMVVAEAARFPELGRFYYQNGAVLLLQRLEDFFAAAMKQGRLRRADPRRAAEQFIGLVRGDLQLRALLGMGDDTSGRQREAVIEAGVDTFQRAFAPSGRTVTR